ncbi:hypothetical protein Tco_0455447 [Tanacetum coccineum]
MVEGEEDEESYAGEFADSMINNDVDDFGNRIEAGSHKENPEVVDDNDDDVNVIEKRDDEKKDNNVEKMDDVVEKDNVDHLDHKLIKEVLDNCNNVVPELTFAKTNEVIKEEMPRLVDLAVHKDREIASTSVPELISKEFVTHRPKMIKELFRKHMQNTILNLYPTSSTTSSLTATMLTADLQYLLPLNIKSKPQDQATDPELWEILKAKFDKPYVSNSYRLFAHHDKQH